MHSIEAKFVIGSSDILFAGVYLCTFQPEYFTAWDSEGVKAGYNSPCIDTASFSCCAVIKALHCLLLYFAAMVHDAIIAGPPDTHGKG